MATTSAQVTSTPTAATQTTYPQASTTSSDMIAKQSAQALAAKIASAQKARDESVNGYNQQVKALPGEYQPLKNAASLQGSADSRAIDEQMSAQGNWRSGYNQSAQTQNNASTANTIGGYNLQQQNAVDKLKAAIAQTKANYGYDVTTATAETESQKLASMISQANTDKGFNQAQQQIDNQASQFTVTTGLQQQQIDNAASAAAAQIGLGQSQLAAQIAQNGVDNIYRDKAMANANDQFAEQMGLTRDQYKSGLEQWAKTYTLQAQQVTNQSTQFSQTFGLSQQQLAATISQQGIDNAYRDNAFAEAADQFAAQLNLSRDQYKSQLDQWAKQYKLDETALMGYSGGTSSSSKSSGGSSNGAKRNETVSSNGTSTFNRSTTTPDGKTTYY